MQTSTLKSQCWMAIVFLWSIWVPEVSAGGFLVERPAGWQAKVQAEAVRADLENAMSDAMGHGHGVDHSRLLEMRTYLSAMFESLPKNSYGRVERSMVRYALHRYFAEKYAITVKGLEPNKYRHTNPSQVGAQILLDNVPAYVENVLEGRFAHHGFGLEDTVVMAATLEQLVLGSGSHALQKAYNLQNFDSDAKLNRRDFEELLNAYVLQWLVGDGADIDSLALRDNRNVIEDSVPQWSTIKEFARGEVDRVEYDRQSTNPFASEVEYSFKDALKVVRSITENFGHFWEQTCQEIKGNLISEEDSANPGRVRLSSFYRKNVHGGEWRFGESETYLRELGVLDDTSSWRGPQVIVPNYMQAASNCIITSTYYLVCCINECEARLKQVESAVKAPTAEPSQIIDVVANMTAAEVGPSVLQSSLKHQLNRIAETHGGMIPLHGRLFSQWMHFAFPQECPFPQRTAKDRTPSEFGDDHIASEQEMNRHIEQAQRTDSNRQQNGIVEDGDQERWAQWLHEEDLLAEYYDLQPRMVNARTLTILSVILAAVGYAFRLVSFNTDSVAKSSPFSLCAKQHLV
eukprot:gnl/MRDRNA2_/MRDRNA2_97373_c0_seq1.p1 gnl/MRDRNA2_/MRDRNA2_97373_c0~~gnl/MRDRNA2_/MRDRNA2_97373_c0_seq1.p1  ORF type:complete len:574 (+),score=119.32 gnl/MRDRNA2_/MRDRNA2_97373_c0_seq1:79-1800(+)